ncbi:unnamed protein product [Musa acuminata var. zebrina]
MRDRANWEAWKAGRKPKEVAMSDYLAKVKQIFEAKALIAFMLLCHTLLYVVPLFHSS